MRGGCDWLFVRFGLSCLLGVGCFRVFKTIGYSKPHIHSNSLHMEDQVLVCAKCGCQYLESEGHSCPYDWRSQLDFTEKFRKFHNQAQKTKMPNSARWECILSKKWFWVEPPKKDEIFFECPKGKRSYKVQVVLEDRDLYMCAKIFCLKNGLAHAYSSKWTKNKLNQLNWWPKAKKPQLFINYL